MSSEDKVNLLKYLSETTLQKLDGSEEKFRASELWKEKGVVAMVVRRPGCLLCRDEAKTLSSILPKIQEKGFSLVAVVHETLGVDEFRPFFNGEIFLDPERRFYGPKERWMFLSGLIRPSVWRSILASKSKGVSGNLQGEGRLLGGLFVIGPNDKGILLEHRESQFGDVAQPEVVIASLEVK